MGGGAHTNLARIWIPARKPESTLSSRHAAQKVSQGYLHVTGTHINRNSPHWTSCGNRLTAPLTKNAAARVVDRLPLSHGTAAEIWPWMDSRSAKPRWIMVLGTIFTLSTPPPVPLPVLLLPGTLLPVLLLLLIMLWMLLLLLARYGLIAVIKNGISGYGCDKKRGNHLANHSSTWNKDAYDSNMQDRGRAPLTTRFVQISFISTFMSPWNRELAVRWQSILRYEQTREREHHIVIHTSHCIITTLHIT